MQLTVNTRQTRPGVITVTLLGRLDGQTHGLLDQGIGRILDEPVKTLVLDLQGVDFITSAGIGTIMKARTSLARKGEAGDIHNGADDNASGVSAVLVPPAENPHPVDETLRAEFVLKFQQCTGPITAKGVAGRPALL